MKNIAIILASGVGSRSGLNIPKQFYKIYNKTVLEYSIEAFEFNENIDEIIIVANPNFIHWTEKLSKKYSKVLNVIPGGETRQQSSYNGVMLIPDKDVNVLIHDAVRPFVTQKTLNDCIEALKQYNAINVAIESSDTILEIFSLEYLCKDDLEKERSEYCKQQISEQVDATDEVEFAEVCHWGHHDAEYIYEIHADVVAVFHVMNLSDEGWSDS